MTRSLSRLQSVFLGFVVLACLGAGGWALFHIGERQGLFADTFEVSVYVADAQDVDKGTPVRIKGVEAGQVIAVEYPDDDSDDAMVRVRLRLSSKYQSRLFADAAATIQSRGLIGNSVVAIAPGKPSAGPLTSGIIQAKAVPDIAEVTAKLHVVAQRVDDLLKDVQESNGTLVKLLKDDELYNEIRSMTGDARKAIRTANGTIETVQGELTGLKDLVRTGKDAASAIRQDADAIKALPIIRSYVDDPVSHLVRPSSTRERQFFAEADLFEPNTAVLHDRGRDLLTHSANWLNGNKAKGSDIVIVSFADPKNAYLTPASAKKLTEKQSEVISEFLKEKNVRKVSFWSRRNITPVGYGIEPSPVVEREALPPAHTQILLFIPAS